MTVCRNHNSEHPKNHGEHTGADTKVPGGVKHRDLALRENEDAPICARGDDARVGNDIKYYYSSKQTSGPMSGRGDL